MKRIIKIGTLMLVMAVVVNACKDDDDDTSEPKANKTTITVNFESTVGSEELVINNEYIDYKGRKFKVELFKFYVSNFKIYDANQNATLVKDVALIDFQGDRGFQVEVDPGEYDGISLGIGLDPVQNASDPATFMDTHPLSTAQNTYWSWAAKYKFIMLEGKADLDGNDTLESIYGYHTGLDTMYRVKTITNAFTVNNESNTNLRFSVDINEIFSLKDTVDYVLEPNWHGAIQTVNIGIKLSDNFIESLETVP